MEHIDNSQNRSLLAKTNLFNEEFYLSSYAQLIKKDKDPIEHYLHVGENMGLMPNPKVGTVTPDVAGAVKNAKAGQVRYRTDKAGIIHCSVGKASFDVASLKANIDALLVDLGKAKPSSAKGTYFKKVSVSSTMGPGIPVDKATLDI